MSLYTPVPLLHVEQLTVQHDSRIVLAPFDWTVLHGERWAILGANGTGKTSVLHALLGIHSASAQSIRLNGCLLSELSVREQAAQRIWVPQRYDEPFTLTVVQALVSVVDGLDDEGIYSILSQFGLVKLAHHWVHTLSGGERQRLTWAMSFARMGERTQLWLLDEPLAAQDLAWQAKLLEQLRATSCAVIAAVHDLNQVARFATHVLLIQKHSSSPATVVRAGRVEEVMEANALSMAYNTSLRHIQAGQDSWWAVHS